MKLRTLHYYAAFALVGTLSWACGGDPLGDDVGTASGAGAAGSTTASDGGQGGAPVPVGSLPACTPDGVEEPPHADIPGGDYAVPVPPELQPYATYPVGDISLCSNGAGIELGYSLPALLVGRAERVSFAGAFDETTGAFVLTSEDGTSTCVVQRPEWSCVEEFTGIVVDLDEVAKETEGLDAAEAAARLEVARLFANDPIGLLDFSLPQ